MNFNKELQEMKEDFEFYKKNLMNKNYMFIYSEFTNRQLSKLQSKINLNNLKIFEINFKQNFFPHALGIKIYNIKTFDFIEKLENELLETKDYSTDISRGQKRIALKNLPIILRKPLIIGNYSKTKINFNADRLLGTPGNNKNSTIGLLIGVIKSNIKNFNEYIPNSLQYEVTEGYIVKNTERKILFTLEKEQGQEKYTTILFKAKDIPIHNLYYNETIKQYLSIELQEKIKKQITNYNCLTGEPINIQTHSSGENKWIGKKDIEKYGIEKKADIKEEMAKIAVIMTGEEMEEYKKSRGMETEETTKPSNQKKLYIISVPYYNVSDLKITKEIEQKFVPMREKEKTIEKDLDKGIER